jgi:hypothetical protein
VAIDVQHDEAVQASPEQQAPALVRIRVVVAAAPRGGGGERGDDFREQ